MDQRQQRLNLCWALNELGLRSSLTSELGRFIANKALYIAQESGFPLGYDFQLYLKGPFSFSLNRDLEGNLPCYVSQAFLGGHPQQDRLDLVKPLIKGLQGRSSKEKDFQTYTSILFLSKQGRGAPSIMQALTKMRPNLHPKEVKKILDNMASYKLV